MSLPIFAWMVPATPLALERLNPNFESLLYRASVLGTERVLGGQHAMGPCDHLVGGGKARHFGEELIT